MRRPRGFWPEVIYKAVQSCGGQACLTPDIYDWVENHIDLSDRERSPSPHKGRPYYVNTVRGIASDMADKGLLIRVSDGCYQLPSRN